MNFSQVLVVEDDASIRSLLVRTLSREGIAVDEASDGREALEKVLLCEYSVILLDYMMPRLNGADFLRHYREQCPQARSILIMITANEHAPELEDARASVHALVTKPFELEAVVEMVRAAMRMFGDGESALPEGNAAEASSGT